jgi:asparagine synthase (glutamine-hydrolysing)
MCGIAGIVSKERSSAERVKRMTDAMSHRGPDGDGFWQNEDGNIVLGHRRLSIIDLSDKGKQPMHYQNRYTITFNGEIYNYLELKKNLEADGFKFTSDTDTEVLLALYSKHKEHCLSMLDGMFAFVIYDASEKSIFGARDRFGEKPFYYQYTSHREFSFASEIKALLNSGTGNTVNDQMLANFLTSNYRINNPQDLRHTFYRDIFKLPAGCSFTLNSAMDLKITEYWKVNLSATNANITFEEAKEEFRYLFSQSVSHRLRSDVPIGSSLSGGLDSSSIVCQINDLNKDRAISQNTFSARFKDFNKDEGQFINYLVDKTQANAYFTWPDEQGFIADFDDLLYSQDEPFPSASIYAQYCVMKKAKEANVTVLLDGQGADEILAGYEYYLQTYLNGLKQNHPKNYEEEYQAIITNNANFIPAPEELIIASNPSLKNLVKNVVRPFYKAVNPKKYASVAGKPIGLLTNEFQESLSDNWRFSYSYETDNLKAHLWHSVKYDNLEDLLRFSDRNSMAHSREVRLPFLNTKLVEFLFTLPVEFLVQKGWTKYILRESLQDLLPKEIAWRKDKIGYEPPQKKWLQNPVFVSKIQERKNDLIKKGIINKEFDFTEDHDWSILMTQNLAL